MAGGVGFPIEQRAVATVTTPVLASMANRPPALSVSDVGDRVGRGIGVAGRGGDAHRGAVRRRSR